VTITRVRSQTKKIKKELELNIASPHVDAGYLSSSDVSSKPDEEVKAGD